MELANLKELVEEYRSMEGGGDAGLLDAIVSTSQRAGMLTDLPITTSSGEVLDLDTVDIGDIPKDELEKWIGELSVYLVELQNRLFSSGLRTLGDAPTEEEIKTYLGAYYGDEMSEDEINKALDLYRKRAQKTSDGASLDWWNFFLAWFKREIGIF